MRSIQDRWHADTEPAFPEERWFDSLTLDSVAAVDGQMVFVFRDPFGQRWGWQWRYAALAEGDPDWRELLSAHLGEELVTGGWSLPDAEGVRWLQSGTR